MPPASTASTLFLGLEPDTALAELVCTYKRRVLKLVGSQTFLDHPPHLTLYLAAFASAAAVTDAAGLLVREFSAIKTSVLGWHTFLADQLTGRHTLVCQLDEASIAELRAVQRRVIEALAPLRSVSSTTARYENRLTSLSEVERASIVDSGFPYTGQHWHPHLTIASIAVEAWPSVERELLPDSPQLDGSFPTLVVYRLVNEHPVALCRFPLARAHISSHHKRLLAS